MARTSLRTIALAGYRSYNNDFVQNQIELKNLNIIIGANGETIPKFV